MRITKVSLWSRDSNHIASGKPGAVQFLAAMAFEGNPYDGHTLKATAAKTETMTGVPIERIYVDKGYRGHDYQGEALVMLSGRARGLTPTMKRELKRRSAIEPMIGHAKNDGRLGRNWLLGVAGDKINALLAAAGHNLRLILKRLALLVARIVDAVLAFVLAEARISAVSTHRSVFANTGIGPTRLDASMV
jgi:IS5 family transposase